MSPLKFGDRVRTEGSQIICFIGTVLDTMPDPNNGKWMAWVNLYGEPVSRGRWIYQDELSKVEHPSIRSKRLRDAMEEIGRRIRNEN